MLEDLRDALRQLRKAPGFTATAIITLALGIGATTAIFTLVQKVMLKSLPVTRPDELWKIGDKIRCRLVTGQLYGVKPWDPTMSDPGHSPACYCRAGSLVSPGAACSGRAADGGAPQRVTAAKRAALRH